MDKLSKGQKRIKYDILRYILCVSYLTLAIDTWVIGATGVNDLSTTSRTKAIPHIARRTSACREVAAWNIVGP